MMIRDRNYTQPREPLPEHYTYEDDDPLENTRPDIHVPVVTDFELEYRTCRCACHCPNEATAGFYCENCDPEVRFETNPIPGF